MLEIIERTTSETTVLELIGPLQFADGEAALRATVASLVSAGRARLDVCVEHVTGVDAAGLGALVWAKIIVDRAGGMFVLVNPGRHLRRLLDITKLRDAFVIVEDPCRLAIRVSGRTPRVDPTTREFLTGAADMAGQRCKEKDQGLWEVRGGPRGFLSSKLMRWVASGRLLSRPSISS